MVTPHNIREEFAEFFGERIKSWNHIYTPIQGTWSEFMMDCWFDGTPRPINNRLSWTQARPNKRLINPESFNGCD